MGVESANESQRDSAPKPKVARDELPWERWAKTNDPNGVAAMVTCNESVRNCRNRVAVENPWGTLTQGSSATLG
jgi:hypothetical protein